MYFLCQIVYEIDLVIFVIFLEIFVQSFRIVDFYYFLFSRIFEVVVKESEYCKVQIFLIMGGDNYFYNRCFDMGFGGFIEKKNLLGEVVKE